MGETDLRQTGNAGFKQWLVRGLADPFSQPFAGWILAINAVFGTVGFYWYRAQLPATPASLWLFVPDCPLYADLMALTLGLVLLRRRQGWFETIVFLSLIKYGFWTVTALALHWADGGAVTAEGVALFVGHAGMLAEGIVYSRRLPFGAREVAAAIGWFFLNDYMDYFQGTAPWLPNPAHVVFVRPFTFALSGVIAVVGIVLLDKRRLRRHVGQRPD